MRAAHLLPAALAIAAAVGCGSAPADPVRAGSTATDPAPYEAGRGFYVSIPSGWHRAERRLTALTDPVELLVAATYRPRPGSQGCGPVALDGFDADEALVTILERDGGPRSGWPGFPPRPARFGFEAGRSSEFTDCLRTTRGIPLRDHWFNFTDAGRYFHVLVAIGADAPAGAEAKAYRMLDSLRVDPRR